MSEPGMVRERLSRPLERASSNEKPNVVAMTSVVADIGERPAHERLVGERAVHLRGVEEGCHMWILGGAEEAWTGRGSYARRLLSL